MPESPGPAVTIVLVLKLPDLKTLLTVVPAFTDLLPVVVLLVCATPLAIRYELNEFKLSVCPAGKFDGAGGTNFPKTTLSSAMPSVTVVFAVSVTALLTKLPCDGVPIGIRLPITLPLALLVA